MADSLLRIAQSHIGQVCVVALAGRIDSSNASEVLKQLNSWISSGEKNILIDFTGVLYLTSAAFRVLLVATDDAERNAAHITLCSLAGHVRELFEMGGLLEAFTIHGSREEALARLG
jgi:anti-sigma B factor antagonist